MKYLRISDKNSSNCEQNSMKTFRKWVNPCKILPKNARKFDENFLQYWGLSGAKACTSCRSRQELSNEYFLAKFGVGTEENEPYKVCSFGWEIRKGSISNLLTKVRALLGRAVVLALLDRDSYAGDWVHLDSLARKDAARTRLQAPPRALGQN